MQYGKLKWRRARRCRSRHGPTASDTRASCNDRGDPNRLFIFTSLRRRHFRYIRAAKRSQNVDSKWKRRGIWSRSCLEWDSMARPSPAHRRQPSRFTLQADELLNDAPERRTAQDDATVKFIKRVLCKKHADPAQDETTAPEVDGNLEGLLPRLTSRSDIDLQLYAILAVVLSQFVQSWYNRITPDADFVGEVVQIVAHCTRGLEHRLKLVDLDSLLLDELPGLLDAHLQGARSDWAAVPAGC